MFGFFKKKEPAQPELTEEELAAKDAVRAFGADFLSEEMVVEVVTGPTELGTKRLPGTKLWQLTMELTAWMDEDTYEIHQGEFLLEALGDDNLCDYLNRRIPQNFLLQFQARLSKDGRRLFLMDTPRPVFDRDLKAILDEQTREVTLETEDLGTFVLDRTVGWFQSEVEWLGSPIALTLDQAPEEEMFQAQETARALLARAEEWDRDVRFYAVDELLDYANQWAEDELMEEDEELPMELLVTPEQFEKRLVLDCIHVKPEGGFTFWYNDNEMVWGDSVHVSGNLEEGPFWAQMEG